MEIIKRQVSLIGAGHVAGALGRALRSKGWMIRQVWSRTPGNAALLAAALEAQVADSLVSMDKEADIYIIAVTDAALPDIAGQLQVDPALVIHTAGSVSMQVLKNASSRYGVFWPIKMIRGGKSSLIPMTAAIDASGADALAVLELLGETLEARVVQADDSLRKKLHLLASVTANLSNHLYTLAADYCAAEQIDFSILHPIIQDTAQRLSLTAPALNQAGPAFRGDSVTLEQHRELLKAYPSLLAVYKLLTEDIYRYYHPEQTGV